ncbi:hypothetical protein D3C75_1223580 [compost metagenome]
MGREPVVEVQDHSGEKARFTDAQQKAQHIEHGARFDVEQACQRHGVGHGHGNHRPTEHDPGDPEPCAKAV